MIDRISSAVGSAAAPGPSQTPSPQKTVRACQEEWRANKAANQASGITEKAYVAQCRGGGTTAASCQAAALGGRFHPPGDDCMAWPLSSGHVAAPSGT